MHRLVLSALCGLFPLAAQSAEITLGTYESGETYVFIEGDIERGDADRFKQIVSKSRSSSRPGLRDVWLNSPGGKVHDALQIGLLVDGLGLRTKIDGNEICLSACALIWLGGAKRFASKRALIGFHATSVDSGISHYGNAAVQRYLDYLGYGTAVQDYAITPNPDEMNYLTAQKARELGITFDHLED